MNPNDYINPVDLNEEIRPGLTKREWLIGMIIGHTSDDKDLMTVRARATWAIELADEIIKQLNEHSE